MLDLKLASEVSLKYNSPASFSVLVDHTCRSGWGGGESGVAMQSLTSLFTAIGQQFNCEGSRV